MLCLIPISFHSLQNQTQPGLAQYDKIIDILPKGDGLPKKGIIVDDNSATGITIEKTKDSIKKNT